MQTGLKQRIAKQEKTRMWNSILLGLAWFAGFTSCTPAIQQPTPTEAHIAISPTQVVTLTNTKNSDTHSPVNLDCLRSDWRQIHSTTNANPATQIHQYSNADSNTHTARICPVDSPALRS